MLPPLQHSVHLLPPLIERDVVAKLELVKKTAPALAKTRRPFAGRCIQACTARRWSHAFRQPDTALLQVLQELVGARRKALRCILLTRPLHDVPLLAVAQRAARCLNVGGVFEVDERRVSGEERFGGRGLEEHVFHDSPHIISALLWPAALLCNSLHVLDGSFKIPTHLVKNNEGHTLHVVCKQPLPCACLRCLLRSS